MAMQDLYQNVLMVILIGMVVGVGVLTLDKFGQADGITTDAGTAINASRDAVGGIASNWMDLVVTIVILVTILALVIGGFFWFQKRGGR